jgi:hypothetical protein
MYGEYKLLISRNKGSVQNCYGVPFICGNNGNFVRWMEPALAMRKVPGTFSKSRRSHKFSATVPSIFIPTPHIQPQATSLSQNRDHIYFGEEQEKL